MRYGFIHGGGCFHDGDQFTVPKKKKNCDRPLQKYSHLNTHDMCFGPRVMTLDNLDPFLMRVFGINPGRAS